ncbi:MAG: dihydropteroate synthase [Bacillota bacterium]
MRLGPRTFEWGRRTYVMGILNVTPDSFSDGGLHLAPERAIARARAMEAEGADVIDIGAESASIAASKPSLDEELARLLPVVETLARESGAALSVDTYKSAVAEAVLKAGAHLINDISGLQADPDLAAVIAQHGAGVVIMHMQGHPRSVAREPRYNDVLDEVAAYLAEGIERALRAGIREEAILIDPGIGVGKRTSHNLELIRRIGELRRRLGFPVLLGHSRTSVIGNVLEAPVHDRAEGTLAVTVFAVTQGVDMVRVHDVGANVRAARMADALVRGIDEPADGWPFDAVTGQRRRPLRPVGAALAAGGGAAAGGCPTAGSGPAAGSDPVPGGVPGAERCAEER